MKLPELLSPARSLDTVLAAFEFGADAVYLGVGHLNLRAHSMNLSAAELREALILARQEKKQIYIALNILPDDSALQEIRVLLQRLANEKVYPDAFIVTDPGVISLCRSILPSVPLHLSTQSGTFNSEAMRFWSNQGIERFILPRELTLQQIRDVTAAGIAQTEIFVHGAMCVAVSGRCLIGAYLAGRHPNFGDCPQYCRVPFEVRPVYDKNTDQTAEWLELVQEPSQSFLFNSRDLNALSLIKDIIESGVTSLKIEGRNKSHHYIASVTKVYREALDSYAANPTDFSVQKEWLEELERLDHRPYTTGFYGDEISLQDVFGEKKTGRVQIVGIVRELTDDGAALIDVKFPFQAGDVLDILSRKGRARSAKAAGVKAQKDSSRFKHSFESIADCNGRPLAKALTNRIVRATPARGILKLGDILRILPRP